MPFELKETTFKNGMGFGGTMVVDHFLMAGFLTNVVLAGWCVNWSYQVGKVLSSSISKMDLHDDGLSVTLHPRFGSPFKARIADITKQRHEKSLVETHEESFLFPVHVEGKGRYYLHGQGHESIKHGEIFRAIVNGQSIKL